MAILDSLLQIGVREEELAIEPARSFRDPRIQSFEVVGAADHYYTVIGVQAVDFIEEVRSNAVGHEGIKVLKDEVHGASCRALRKISPSSNSGGTKLYFCRSQRNALNRQFLSRYLNWLESLCSVALLASCQIASELEAFGHRACALSP